MNCWVITISRTIATSFPLITTFERISITCTIDSIAIAKVAVVTDLCLVEKLENSDLFH